MAKKSNYRKEDAELEKSYKSVAGKYSKKPTAKQVKSNRIAITIICIIMFLLIAGMIFCAIHFDLFNTTGSISAKMTMAGVDITGMSYNEAVKAVKSATDTTYSQKNMIVKLGEDSITLTPDKTGISLNVEAAVKAACQVQSVENGAFDLTNYFTINKEAVRAELNTLIGTIEKTMVPSSYEVTGETPDLNTEEEPLSGKTILITIGYPGIDLNIDDLYAAVMQAYSSNSFEVDYPLIHVEPTAPDLEKAKAEHCIEAVSAQMDDKTFEISQHAYGYSFDEAEILEALKTAEYGQVLQFNFKRIRPEKTYDDLYNTLFQDVLAILGPLNFYTNFRINSSISAKKLAGI